MDHSSTGTAVLLSCGTVIMVHLLFFKICHILKKPKRTIKSYGSAATF